VFTPPASSREMPEEQNFAPLPRGSTKFGRGWGVRRDFQYTFWDLPVATICGRSDPLTRGWDLLTDSTRPLMGGRTSLGQFRTHTDTKLGMYYFFFVPFARLLHGPPRCFPAREDLVFLRFLPAIEHVFLLVLRLALAMTSRLTIAIKKLASRVF
jgi:hypothetical protein